MTDLGHVWTAPWQQLSDVSAALVGCGHVSGLLMRSVWPLTLMLCADRVPNKNAHFRRSALTQAGSPDPRNNRICITSARTQVIGANRVNVVAEKCLIAPNALTALALIHRNIGLVRDLDPALRFQTHQVSELLRSHGFGFGALI
jgi:hypothetical protein